MSDPAATEPRPLWEQRFAATRISLPDWAEHAPDRCLYVSNPTGTFELYAWDRGTDGHRQVTDRAEGTTSGTISPDGELIWWFDDTDGDEFGVWRTQPFAGGPDSEAVPGLEASYPAGLALGEEVVAVGRSSDGGSSVHLVPWSDGHAVGRPVEVYRSTEDAHVADLSADGTLLAIGHSEHGDAMKPAVRVYRLSGGQPVTGRADGTALEPLADLWDGPGKGLDVAGFSPVPGDSRLLLVHEREGRRLPLLWDPVTGTETRVDPAPGDLTGEVEWDPDWYPDGSALLLHADSRGRGRLYRHDLATGELDRLTDGPGSVGSATARPDGVEFSWSSGALPTEIRRTDGSVVLTPAGDRPPPSLDLTDLDADGPGGAVHALLAVPPGDGPFATVFLVHGGPMGHDTHTFAADRAAYLDHGYAVVQVNYRGSTGYGAAWQDALIGRPGLTELEDVLAVRERLVADGVTDPDRCVLTGGSWGGYLTLMGLGTAPEAWACGVAAVPVADYVTAYADEMEGLKAIDRSFFGGSPDQVPESYTRSSPLTYVDRVAAPVLVLAGANDPRCPLRQIENYLTALTAAGKPHEVYRFDAGHGSMVVAERIRQMRVELEFVLRHVPPG